MFFFSVRATTVWLILTLSGSYFFRSFCLLSGSGGFTPHPLQPLKKCVVSSLRRENILFVLFINGLPGWAATAAAPAPARANKRGHQAGGSYICHLLLVINGHD